MLRNVGRWIAYPLIAVAVTLVTGLIALPRGPGGTPERDYSMAVTSFDATYALEPQDGGALDVLVTEAIVVDFSSAGRHGIVRAIPLRFGSHPVGVSEVRVEARLHAQGDAAPDDAWRGADVLETRDRDTVELRIGSPTVELAEGAQEFRIGYRLEDIALNTPEGQEVYLDVNGTGWGSPFGRVTARLQVPGSLAGRLTGANACYQGPPGSTARCTTVTRPGADATEIVSTATDLEPFETMTIATDFEPDTFAVAWTPPERTPWGGLWLLLPPIGALIVLLSVLLPQLVSRLRRNRQVLVTRFQPPEGLEPLVAADVWGVPGRGPAAQLLAMVVRGEARITTTEPPASQSPAGPERPTGRELARLRGSLRVEGLEDRDDRAIGALMRGIFGLRRLGDPNLADSLLDRRRSLVDRAGQRRPVGRAGGWFLPTFVALVIGAAVCTAAGVGRYAMPLELALASTTVAVLLLVLAVYRTPTSGPLTSEGEATYQHLRGLENFMRMSEADRIAWLQNTASAPRVQGGATTRVGLYEPLLPYAVIFGLEDSWVELIGQRIEGVPDVAEWLPTLRGLRLGDVVAALTHGNGGRVFQTQAMAGINHGIGQRFNDTRRSISAAFQSAGDGGSRGGWSSGSGASGGGHAGGGMGGGGGSSW